MSELPTRFDDDDFDFDQPDADFDSSSAVALLEPDENTALADAGPDGPQCEKCGAPFASDLVTVCRRCGWYESLGIFVEVDPDWEVETEGDATATREAQSKIGLSAIPAWSWILLISFLAVVAESIAACYLTPAGSRERMLWSLVQLAIGGIAVLICHVFNFIVQSTDDADLGLFDVLVKPVNLWVRAARALPLRLWMVNLAACGLAAAVLSVAVIGAIPYDALWNWGGDAKKPNLLKAVTSAARTMPAGNDGANLAELAGDVRAGGHDSLDDAIGDFAGSQNIEADGGAGGGDDAALSGGQSAEGNFSTVEGDERKEISCAIIGYRLDDRGRVAVLVLAAPHRGQLAYAGWVRPQLEDAQMIDLAERLAKVRTHQPILQLHLPADWVWPKHVCRVTYSERLPDGRLADVEWDGLNGTVQNPKN